MVCYGHFNILHLVILDTWNMRAGAVTNASSLIGDEALSEAGGQKFFSANERANGLSVSRAVDQVIWPRTKLF